MDENVSKNPKVKIRVEDRIYVYAGRIKIWGYGESDKVKDEEVNSFDNFLGGEVTEVIDEINRFGLVILQGDLGVGKSEISAKIAQVRSYSGDKTIRIEGHDTKVPYEKINSLFVWALRNNAVLMYDSFDYLLVGSKKFGRGLKKEIHEQRTKDLLNLILRYKKVGLKIVLTIHNGDWLDRRGDPELLKYLNELFCDEKVHSVKGIFSNSLSIVEYYKGMMFKFKEEIGNDRILDILNLINKVANLPWDDDFISWLFSNLSPKRQNEKLIEKFGSERLKDLKSKLETMREYELINYPNSNSVVEEHKSFRFHKLMILQLLSKDPGAIKEILENNNKIVLFTMLYDFYIDQLVSRLYKVLVGGD
ncbi:MAG: hypothetical protein ABI721_03035 [Candidatus Dojkabacteria bacterium]